MTTFQIIIWTMLVCQMVAWGWFTHNAGKLDNKPYFVFTIGMMLGQTAGTIETYVQHAWRTMFMQIYFFGFTAYGGYKRWKQANST